jgi:hypothetical protein
MAVIVPGDQKRRLQVADLMIVVAAAALAVFWIRAFLNEVQETMAGLSTIFKVSYWLMACVPVLSMAGIAVLLMEFSGGNVPLRRRMRRPGFAACGVMAILPMLPAVLTVIGQLLYSLMPRKSWVHFPWWDLTWSMRHFGIGVAAVWLAYALSRRWPSERTWLDRFERGLGIAWILVWLGEVFVHFLRLFFI